MNLRMMNEAFKRTYSDVLTESTDSSCKEELRKELKDAAMQAIVEASGLSDMAKFKRVEIALQSVLERNFPDNCWWEVTGCQIFWDLMEHQNASLTCDNIIDKLNPGFCEDDSPAEPEFVDTRKQSIISGDPSMDNGCDLLEDADNDNDASQKVGQELIDKLNSDSSFSGNPSYDEDLFVKIGYRLTGDSAVDYDDPKHKTYWFTLVDKDNRYKFSIESSYDAENLNGKFYLDKVEEISRPVKEAVSNPERTISKVDRNLAKEVDKDLVRDLTLILENEGEVYRRSIVPVINNLKKKKAKGQFDEKLAIQAFFHVVEGALKQPWFKHYYSYSIATVSVPERYAVAKDLLDGFMEEIEFEDTAKHENLSISKIRK